MPLLYTYRRCPYAMRARMALLVAGRAFEAHEIVLRDKPAALLAASPKGTVPVLCLDDGRVIDESWAIMAWALAGEAAPGWWAQAQSAENLALLAANDGPFKQHLDRYKYPERHGDCDRPLHRARAAELLQALDTRLSSTSPAGRCHPLRHRHRHLPLRAPVCRRGAGLVRRAALACAAALAGPVAGHAAVCRRHGQDPQPADAGLCTTGRALRGSAPGTGRP